MNSPSARELDERLSKLEGIVQRMLEWREQCASEELERVKLRLAELRNANSNPL